MYRAASTASRKQHRNVGRTNPNFPNLNLAGEFPVSYPDHFFWVQHVCSDRKLWRILPPQLRHKRFCDRSRCCSLTESSNDSKGLIRAFVTDRDQNGTRFNPHFASSNPHFRACEIICLCKRIHISLASIKSTFKVVRINSSNPSK